MEPTKNAHGPCPRCGGELSLRHTVETPEPEHPYTFFGAKTAATFIQLNADHRETLGRNARGFY